MEEKEKLPAKVLAKLEYFNPAGSAKDRVALSMIRDAEERGILKTGSTIIEPTSGNTGIGLACVAAARGYRTIIVMPDSMSAERRMLMGAYGAELVLTPGAQGMTAAIAKAEELAKELPGSWIAGQFVNPANPMIHRHQTGLEILEQVGGPIDGFCSGIGTGGTITGAGSYLKAQNPKVQIVAVEPAASPLLSGGEAGPHGLQGIGANFIPEILNTAIYDEIFPVSGEEAYAAGRAFSRCEGILIGISSGAALFAARLLALRPENNGKTIVALLADSGERYLSTELFN